MVAHPSVNLQDSFLNQVRKDSVEVEFRLLDGTSLKGLVNGFDNFTVILHVGEVQHMVYKHAVAHVIASRPVRTSPPSSDARRRGQSRPSGAPDRRPDRPAKAKDKDKAPRKPKDEKFNALDLSKVKLSEAGDAPAEEEK